MTWLILNLVQLQYVFCASTFLQYHFAFINTCVSFHSLAGTLGNDDDGPLTSGLDVTDMSLCAEPVNHVILLKTEITLWKTMEY